MERLVVANGLKQFEIADDNGNVRGVLTINPADINIFTRAKEVVNKIDEAKDKISRMKDIATEDEALQLIEELDKDMRDAVNYLMQDDNASNVVFGNQNVLNTYQGVTFIERFLYAIIPVINKEIKTESDKATEAMNKYISKYTK